MVDAIERILNSTQSYRMCFDGDHVNKDIFLFPSLRKVCRLKTISDRQIFD
uniref:Transposase n=1 Tax=Heterorhabditis bacteriophora TaxID=37862 RepID=A0A1I7W7T5_HETBA